MTYLLDTSAWYRSVSHDASLPADIRRLIQQKNAQFGLSIFSLWEIGKKVQIGKLNLPMSLDRWLDHAVSANITVLPLSHAIITDAMSLPDFPNNDPADELITATARIHDMTLLTTDRLLKKYPHAKVKYFRAKKSKPGTAN